MPVRHCALPPGLTTVTREFTVAGGRFAPGHLGELTQVLPFDLVDAVLKETLSVQRRLRELPSRVGAHFVLAMCLFPEVGYRLMWQKLTAALTGAGLEIAWPTAKALRDLRRRVGAAPTRHLFDILAGALARPTTRGVRFGPFRTVSFDGCSSIKVPQSDRNLDRFGPQNRGGYPMAPSARARSPGRLPGCGFLVRRPATLHFGPRWHRGAGGARRGVAAVRGRAMWCGHRGYPWSIPSPSRKRRRGSGVGLGRACFAARVRGFPCRRQWGCRWPGPGVP